MELPEFLGSNPEFDVLKAKLSQMKLRTLAPDEPQIKKLQYIDVVKILKDEISSMDDLVTFETLKREMLIEEDEKISKYIEEEENIVACINKYIESKHKDNESLIDEQEELFFKLEVLHRKIIKLIKKFVRRYFSHPLQPDNDDLFQSRNFGVNMEQKSKKSLFDIFAALLIEFMPDNANHTGVLHIDDTVCQEHIDMLLCADIIERCPEDLNFVKLKLL